MAYPTVSKPYGFKPINLIGGQPYAGSTRMFKIASGYDQNIFYGDPVKILRDDTTFLPTDGTVVLQARSWFRGADFIPAPTYSYNLNYQFVPYTVGVFMGCTFTNPYTKQKTFSQYYPANTVANDIQAYVVDDPDALFKVVYVANTYDPGYINSDLWGATGVVPDYVGMQYIGRNLLVAVNAGNTNTGDSLYGVADPSNALNGLQQQMMPVRVVDVVPETATADGFVELIVKWNMPGVAFDPEQEAGIGAFWGGGHEYYWPGSAGTGIL